MEHFQKQILGNPPDGWLCYCLEKDYGARIVFMVSEEVNFIDLSKLRFIRYVLNRIPLFEEIK